MLSKELYLLWGSIGAILISYLGYRLRALTVSGGIAAAIVGTIIFGLGGYVAAGVLIFFFLSGSFLSRLPRPSDLPYEKAVRNWKQVVCNGAPPALAVLLVHFDPSYRESGTLFFFAAIATATADTWATEIGIRSGKHAYHILTFRPVARGLSGGVSIAGMIASVFAAVLCAIIPFILLPGDDFLCGLFLVAIIPVISLAGIVGSILDSLIGATLQAKYRAPDGRISDTPDQNGGRISGITFVTNDVTNLIAITWGGLIAVGLTTIF